VELENAHFLFIRGKLLPPPPSPSGIKILGKQEAFKRLQKPIKVYSNKGSIEFKEIQGDERGKRVTDIQNHVSVNLQPRTAWTNSTPKKLITISSHFNLLACEHNMRKNHGILSLISEKVSRKPSSLAFAVASHLWALFFFSLQKVVIFIIISSCSDRQRWKWHIVKRWIIGKPWEIILRLVKAYMTGTSPTDPTRLRSLRVSSSMRWEKMISQYRRSKPHSLPASPENKAVGFTRLPCHQRNRDARTFSFPSFYTA